MARREFTFHKDVGSGRTGLAVMEAQVLHHGHVFLLTQMAAACDTCIVAFGSCDKQGVEGHPFGFAQRRAQVEAVFGDRFKFCELNDIDASVDNDDWLRYVLDRIGKKGLPAPTDYFTGSVYDARWYQGHFGSTGGTPKNSGFAKVYAAPEGNAIHVVDRTSTGIPSGRDIRLLIQRRDEDWRAFVPQRLWGFIEWNYPPHLRQAIVFDIQHRDPPPADEYPVGTRALWRGRVAELKDDGVWRHLSGKPDEKAEYDRRRRSAG